MRRRRSRRAGFTLVEVMMVVLILAIISGAVLPLFEGSTTDAKDAVLRQSLNILRRQIEYFKVEHKGQVPGFNTIPMQVHLWTYSNQNGQASLVKTSSFKYGPYFHWFDQLLNPFNDSNFILASSDPPNESPDEDRIFNGMYVGFFYDKNTGRISANAEGNTKDGTPRIKL